MKPTFVRSTVSASAALVFGAGAYAQTAQTLAAGIGFNFRSIAADLPAGKYTVTVTKSSGNPVFHISNVETRRPALVAAGY